MRFSPIFLRTHNCPEMLKVHIVDDTLDAMANVIVENGIIQEVMLLEEKPDPADPVWLPAFTDLHAHFRDPGFTYKEDVESGSRAAVRGGYTAVNLMPNTSPVVSSLQQARDVETRIHSLGLVYANQVVSMTMEEKGQDCSHLRNIPAGAMSARRRTSSSWPMRKMPATVPPTSAWPRMP